jgi:hypothetical protein
MYLLIFSALGPPVDESENSLFATYLPSRKKVGVAISCLVLLNAAVSALMASFTLLLKVVSFKLRNI